MADQKIIPVPPQPHVPPPAPVAPEAGERVEYRPISILAVAGLLASGLVAAMVLGSVVFSLASDAVYLPGWLVGTMAAGGALVSFVAQRRIVAAEGTRVGLGLTVWGIWLGVLTFTGFFVFKLATEYALESQANHFVMVISADDVGKVAPDTGFVPRLLEGCQPWFDPQSRKAADIQFNSAFLLTIPNRAGNNPEDFQGIEMNFDRPDPQKKSTPFFSQFRDNPMVRFLKETLASVPDKNMVKVEPQGVHSCRYEPPQGKGRGHYVIVRNYQVVTPEIVRVFKLEAKSIEPSGPSERRKWFLAQPKDEMNASRFTDLGNAMRLLRNSVHQTLIKTEKKEIEQFDVTNWEQIFPDVKVKDGPVPFSAKALREIVKSYTKSGKLEIAPFSSVETNPFSSRWREVDGKVQIDYPVQMNNVPGLIPGRVFRFEGHVTVESAAPLDPATVTGSTPPPQWIIKSLRWRPGSTDQQRGSR